VKRFSKWLIRISIGVITVLFVVNFLVTLYNNTIIEENRVQQLEAERIKITVSHFAIEIIHNIDLGVRSFALFKEEKYLFPLYIALHAKDSLFNVAALALQKQGYNLKEFNRLRDSVESYANLNLHLVELLHQHETEKFMKLANKDRGYRLYLQYDAVVKDINAFEDRIAERAKQRYREAERNNYLLQAILFFIAVPTLVITTYHTYQKFKYEVALRKAEVEKSILLINHNQELERGIQERTKEIEAARDLLQAQHDEILAQHEEIITQNDVLQKQSFVLAEQNEELMRSRHEQLDLYTKSLLEKSELIARLNEEIESSKVTSNGIDQEKLANYNEVLNTTILTEDDWEKFKKTFEAVYPLFFANLRFRFPEITSSELRLSALIKLSLSMKEAANTLGISEQSVKKSRNRLRKRFELSEEDSLEKFIRTL